MSDVGLFDAAPYTVVLPEPAPEPKVSADRKRTIRQAEVLARGAHPLAVTLRAHLPLHPEAAPADDRDAPGRRCGTCRWREPGRYAKCLYGWDGDRRHAPPRVTNGPGTDIRAWWPACRDHEPADETPTCERLIARRSHIGPCGEPANQVAVYAGGGQQIVCAAHATQARAQDSADVQPLAKEVSE